MFVVDRFVGAILGTPAWNQLLKDPDPQLTVRYVYGRADPSTKKVFANLLRLNQSEEHKEIQIADARHRGFARIWMDLDAMSLSKAPTVSQQASLPLRMPCDLWKKSCSNLGSQMPRGMLAALPFFGVCMPPFQRLTTRSKCAARIREIKAIKAIGGIRSRDFMRLSQ